MKGLPGNPSTDGGGNYSVQVSWGWSGAITPTLGGYTFSPPSRTYNNVTANQLGNYVGTPPPQPAMSPSPATGQTNVPINVTLSWAGGSGATGYSVYFGPDQALTASGDGKGSQAGTTFHPGTLSYGTTYYWRIDSTNSGGTTTGTLWSFCTCANFPHAATGQVEVLNELVVQVTITDPGYGYTNTPQVWILGSGGSNAQAVATVSNGMVTAVTIISAGSGYGAGTYVVIAGPIPLTLGISPASRLDFAVALGDSYQPQTSQSGIWVNFEAAFVAEATTYSVYVEGFGGGSIYRLVPLPAPATAGATATVVNGLVVEATVTDGGSGYVSPPVVSFLGGGGTGAQATATVSNGMVVAITITDAGHGYTTMPTVVIDPPPVSALMPTSISQAARLDYLGLMTNVNYQLQVSSDLTTWANLGATFTPMVATNSQYTDLEDGARFFRLQY
jgi:hypothetical protein